MAGSPNHAAEPDFQRMHNRKVYRASLSHDIDVIAGIEFNLCPPIDATASKISREKQGRAERVQLGDKRVNRPVQNRSVEGSQQWQRTLGWKVGGLSRARDVGIAVAIDGDAPPKSSELPPR